MDSPSQSRWPGAAKNFTTAIAERIVIEMVKNMAMPPPSGTTLLENLSLTGFATNPKRKAKFLTKPVRASDRTNGPTKRTIDNAINA